MWAQGDEEAVEVARGHCDRCVLELAKVRDLEAPLDNFCASVLVDDIDIVLVVSMTGQSVEHEVSVRVSI